MVPFDYDLYTATACSAFSAIQNSILDDRMLRVGPWSSAREKEKSHASAKAGRDPIGRSHARLGVAGAVTLFALTGAGLGAALLLSVQNNPRLLPLVAVLISALLGGALLFGLHMDRRHRTLTRELSEQEDYRRFIEQAPHGFFRLDEEGRFIEINASLAQTCGYDTIQEFCETINADPRRLYADPRVHAEFSLQIHVKGGVTDFLAKIRRRDGKEIWTVQNARAICGRDGNVRFFEGTLQDVDLQHESLEAAQRALQQTKEAVRAKSAFLSAMSHELKTPLNAIIGFSELMQRQLFGPVQERYRSYLDDIHSNGKALLALIIDVLDFTRAEGGALELTESEFSLTGAIESGLAAALDNHKERPEISIKVPPGFPAMRGDERRICQIFKNILSNAVKFTPQTGRVQIKANLGIDNSLLIQITDTGMGMEPERIAMALEPLKQIDSKLSRRFEGIGLGLPLAQALMRLHGGEMSIVSAPGSGTTVNLAFPPERTVSNAVHNDAS
jgi:PAS domain S-box-containing protein